MSTIHDDEFGAITLRRSARASTIRVSVAPDGTLRASLPLYTPALFVRRFITESRAELRQLMHQHAGGRRYTDGMRVGKSHSLTVRTSSSDIPASDRHGQRIIVSLPLGLTLDDTIVLQALRPTVEAALRLEARSYLPRRLSFLAEKLGFHYLKVRFSHASGRWGSCSSNGTISLNIALMMLPFELIDYVLIHELSHTAQMNHSDKFWQLVSQGDPAYRSHRRALKTETPSI